MLLTHVCTQYRRRKRTWPERVLISVLCWIRIRSDQLIDSSCTVYAYWSKCIRSIISGKILCPDNISHSLCHTPQHVAFFLSFVSEKDWTPVLRCGSDREAISCVICRHSRIRHKLSSPIVCIIHLSLLMSLPLDFFPPLCVIARQQAF